MLKYCNHCKVTVRGSDEVCPLCRNPMPLTESEGLDLLTMIEEEELARDVFPFIPPGNERHMAVRVLSLVSIVAVVASVVLKLLIPSPADWPWFVIMGVVSMWLVVITVMRKRRNISKTIAWQVLILSVVTGVIDWMAGWKGWSLEYAIPIICMTAMMTMTVLSIIFSLEVRDYIMYMILGGLMGLIPLLFLLFGWVESTIPSLLSVATAVIFLSALLIFHGGVIRNETRKRFHV